MSVLNKPYLVSMNKLWYDIFQSAGNCLRKTYNPQLEDLSLKYVSISVFLSSVCILGRGIPSIYRFAPIFLLSCSVLYIFSYNCLNSAFIGTELTSWLPSSVTILEICQANNWLVLFQDSWEWYLVLAIAASSLLMYRLSCNNLNTS